MFKQNDTPGCDVRLPKVSPTSDKDSDNSRDVNLNSKNFTDCNLVGTENKYTRNVTHQTPAELNSNVRPDVELNESGRTEMITQNEKSGGLDKDSIADAENSMYLPNGRKNQGPMANCSTPKPESAESQAFCTSFSISSDSSSESENGTQTYLLAKAASVVTKLTRNKGKLGRISCNGGTTGRFCSSQNDALTTEEIGKKFQDLSFAFKTDSMTIPKRLYLMKRKRDQAETNIENELTVIKSKLKTLQYLGLNSEYVHLMTDLKKQLDFVLNAVIQLSSSAESYGYIQHEEKLLEFITTMLQHVENIETTKSNSFKISQKLKAESKRSSDPVPLDVEGAEGRLLRRRSVAAVTMESNSRRRASIATLPRLGYSTSDSGCNGKGLQWTPARPAGNVVKRLSFSQGSCKTPNNVPGIEDLKRDLNGARHRKESRNSEGSMGNIEEFPESPFIVETKLREFPAADDIKTDANDSCLHLKQLIDSIEEIRRNSDSHEHITAIYCFRRIVEWSMLLLNYTRFRWPETGLQYVPFYITWYVVFVLVLVFMGGLITGINGYYTYSCLKYSALWFTVPALFNFVRRFYRFLLPLLFTFLLALIFAFLYLTEILLPHLNKEEVDSLFKAFGLEIRYVYGPPPV